MNKQQHLEELALLNREDQPLPNIFSQLSDSDLEATHHYVDQVIERHMQGLDQLMLSMVQSMKFIPNVFLQMMAKRYVDPVFAARLTNLMDVRRTVALTKGMPVAYLGEVTAHQRDNALSATILSHLKTKDIEPIVRYIVEHYPGKALDIAHHLPDSLLRKVAQYLDANRFDASHLNDDRRELLKRIQDQI
ncbi:conserved hypothetical protein [gamma proteobacterium HTCC5015]|nr:conserved hypothetical protein [gamma proteobacterium HTCC5015]